MSFVRWRLFDRCKKRSVRDGARRFWFAAHGFPCRERWNAFLHTRLWIGLAPAFAVGFLVVSSVGWILGVGTDRVLVAGPLAGGLCVLGYVLGVWGATGSGEDEEDCGKEAPPVPVWRVRVRSGCLILFFLAWIAWPSVERTLSGERQPAEAVLETLGKLLMLLCVVIPVWIVLRKR